MRNIVCLCSHHHGRFKPQHGRLYWELKTGRGYRSEIGDKATLNAVALPDVAHSPVGISPPAR
jgi:hypothetical protein